MLKVKERQIKLTFLGYYKGDIDGIEGKKTKQAYLNLQKDYFVNNEYRHDIDGIYGVNTDKLLCNLYNVKTICKHFELKEFKCRCKNKYCSGYPDYLSTNLLSNITKLRIWLELPMYLTSGFRCKKWNQIQSPNSPKSRHQYGKAIDFYASGFSSLDKRKEVINRWILYKNSRYSYCNHYAKNVNGYTSNPKASYMGTSVHVDVI